MSSPINQRPGQDEARRSPNQDEPRFSLGSNMSRPRGGLGEVWELAYPAILSQVSVTAMGVVDSAMVGRLGATELASVGFGGIWIWTLFCGFYGMAAVVQTFVAQDHGADRARQSGAWTWQGAWLLTPLAAVLAFVLLFASTPLLALLTPSPSMQSIASEYISIRAVGAVGMCLASVFLSFYRGIGDTRTPLAITVFVNILNVVLDYGLIFGRMGLPEWGVAGAATATVIAEWATALITIGLFLGPNLRKKFGTRPVRPRWKDQLRLLRIGLPLGGQALLEMGSFALFLTFVAWMGENSMAASQAFVSLLSMTFMQAVGIGYAVATLVGRYRGGNDIAAARRSFASSQKLAAGLSVGIGLIFIVFPDPLMRIFTTDPEVIALGRTLLLIGAFYEVMDAFSIVTDGALRGAGDTRAPFVARLLLAWGVQVPLAWLFGIYWEGGVAGAWLGSGVYMLTLSLYLWIRFRSDAWQRIKI